MHGQLLHEPAAGTAARATPFVVTLNRTQAIDPAKILRRMQYHHPVYTHASVRAQARRAGDPGPAPHLVCGRLLGLGFPRGRAAQRGRGLPRTRTGPGTSGWSARRCQCRARRRRVRRMITAQQAAARSTKASSAIAATPRTRIASSYRMAQLFLDLDELDRVFDGRWLWSVGRRNLAEFRRSDYLGARSAAGARRCATVWSKPAGTARRGPISLLTHLRYSGYVFNPVSFYYCYADSTRTQLDCVVAEITNTPWRERHAYVLPACSAEPRGREPALDVRQDLPRLALHADGAHLCVGPHHPGRGAARAHERPRGRPAAVRRHPAAAAAAAGRPGRCAACCGATR